MTLEGLSNCTGLFSSTHFFSIGFIFCPLSANISYYFYVEKQYLCLAFSDFRHMREKNLILHTCQIKKWWQLYIFFTIFVVVFLGLQGTEQANIFPYWPYKMQIRQEAGRYFFHADLTWWQIDMEQANIFFMLT